MERRALATGSGLSSTCAERTPWRRPGPSPSSRFREDHAESTLGLLYCSLLLSSLLLQKVLSTCLYRRGTPHPAAFLSTLPQPCVHRLALPFNLPFLPPHLPPLHLHNWPTRGRALHGPGPPPAPPQGPLHDAPKRARGLGHCRSLRRIRRPHGAQQLAQGPRERALRQGWRLGRVERRTLAASHLQRRARREDVPLCE